MTTLYVSSVDGNNADDGSTWALAKQTVAGALAILTGTGPHIVYVDSAHNFNAGAAILWDAAVAAQRVAIISVDRNTGAWTAGATENVGAATNASFSIGSTVRSQYLFIFGMTCIAGGGSSSGIRLNVATGATTAAIQEIAFKSCTLSTPGTDVDQAIVFGSSGGTSTGAHAHVHCDACVLKGHSSATGSVITFGECHAEFVACTNVFNGTKPTTFASFFTGTAPSIDFLNCDLSGYDTASGNYFSVAAFAGGQLRLINCKLSSTPGMVTGTWVSNGSSILLINTDSGDTNNVFEYRNRLGTITEDTATYMNSGATFNGTAISWKIVTTADCNEHSPFTTPWLHTWVNSTGSALNFDLEILRDSATDFTDREVWSEVETLENASFPLGTFTSTRNAQPFDGTPADLTNSAATWTESMANDNEMRLRVTRTPAEKGLSRARLNIGVASVTLYLDPQLRVSA